MLHFSTLLLLLGLSSLAIPAFAWPKPPTVNLGYAEYQGSYNSTADITYFLGVRYADPPSGEHRFQAPRTPSSVKGTIIADYPPPPCPQGAQGASATQPWNVSSLSKRQSGLTEDCLFLNVFVPGNINPKAKLPVVMWIHGGGYIGGNQASYNGASLVEDAEGGVISVVIQYRLGIFGFLPGAEMKKHGVLNAGLLDQNFALQWIQKHIGSFGGDPSKVTIWGESAGAGSVIQHIVAHGGKTEPPLFRAAMTSSTFLPSQWHYDDDVPEQLYSAVVNAAGCSEASSTFDCLQTADVYTLETVNTQVGLTGFFGTFLFVPVVDGEFIVERPIQTLQKGHHNGQTLFAVTNAFEGSLFVNASDSANGTLTDYVAQLFPSLNSTTVTDVANMYLNIGLDGTTNQAIGVMGESIFICPTYVLLKTFAGHSWKGEFAVPPALHGQDINYYFPQFTGRILYFPSDVFRVSFAEPFLAIVKTLNPNDTPDPANITPDWPMYNKNGTEMLFNETTDAQPEIHTIQTDSKLLERCAVWESLAPIIGQ